MLRLVLLQLGLIAALVLVIGLAVLRLPMRIGWVLALLVFLMVALFLLVLTSLFVLGLSIVHTLELLPGYRHLARLKPIMNFASIHSQQTLHHN
jgi:hypothetical protein